MLIKNELFSEPAMPPPPPSPSSSLDSHQQQHNHSNHDHHHLQQHHNHQQHHHSTCGSGGGVGENHQNHQVGCQYHRAASPGPHDSGPSRHEERQHDSADRERRASPGESHAAAAAVASDGGGVAPSPKVGTKSFVDQLDGPNEVGAECDGRLGDFGAAATGESDTVTIIHFNDCYNIEPGPKSSGAAGFLTAVNQYRHLDPIILFSGDILSPSFMSTFTKGEQMIPVLNDIGVHCAVFGNHEFDYGVDNLIEFTKRTTFPWLLSNVIDKETSSQLGDGRVFHIIERAGVKFGLVGLIEEEWLSTLSTLDSSDVIYEDFVAKGRELARWLKGAPHHVDYVIALTHFRTPNDVRLADSVPEIDLILGGHDHDYEVIKRPNCHVIKSGTDFREFSLIKLKLNALYKSSLSSSSSPSPRPAAGAHKRGDAGAQVERPLEAARARCAKPFKGIDIERVECVSYLPDENLRVKLEKFVTTIDEKMGKVLGQFNCELDGRFSSIRKFETNLGNFVTDIMLASTHADLAILNSGTLRSDRVHPKGDFTMRDLFNILGYIDPIAVLQATGYHIWKALENGVSQWPKLEGRFPQVSGCSFVFDPSKPPLERIDPKEVTIGDEPLDLDKHYKLTTKAYLASGKDGYDILKECKTLVPGDESPDLTTSILNHFEAINIVKSNRRTHHRQSIICLSRSSIKKLLDLSGTSGAAQEQPREQTASRKSSANDDNNNNRRESQSIVAAVDACPMPARLDSTAAIEEEEAAAGDDDDDDDVDELAYEVSGEGRRRRVGRPQFSQPRLSVIESDCKANNNNNNTRGWSGGGGPDARDGNTDKRTECDLAEGAAIAPAGGGPNTSSPLAGATAPTPTLANMAATPGRSGSCGGCGGAMPTPPSTIPRQQAGQPRAKRLMSLYEMECEQCKLEPQIEGRIKILGANWP